MLGKVHLLWLRQPRSHNALLLDRGLPCAAEEKIADLRACILDSSPDATRGHGPPPPRRDGGRSITTDDHAGHLIHREGARKEESLQVSDGLRKAAGTRRLTLQRGPDVPDDLPLDQVDDILGDVGRLVGHPLEPS